jgi:hypothetical protein
MFNELILNHNCGAAIRCSKLSKAAVFEAFAAEAFVVGAFVLEAYVFKDAGSFCS